jgi:hypothetical protein
MLCFLVAVLLLFVSVTASYQLRAVIWYCQNFGKTVERAKVASRLSVHLIQLCAYFDSTDQSWIIPHYAELLLETGKMRYLFFAHRKKGKRRPARREGAPKGARCLLTPVQRHVTFISHR